MLTIFFIILASWEFFKEKFYLNHISIWSTYRICLSYSNSSQKNSKTCKSNGIEVSFFWRILKCKSSLITVSISKQRENYMRDVCKTQDEGVIKWDLITPLPVVSYCKYKLSQWFRNREWRWIRCLHCHWQLTCLGWCSWSLPPTFCCTHVDICTNAKPVAKDKSGLIMT